MADRKLRVPPAPRKPSRHLRETSPPARTTYQRVYRPLPAVPHRSMRSSSPNSANPQLSPPAPPMPARAEPVREVMGPPAPPPPHRPGYHYVLVYGGKVAELPHPTPAPSPSLSPITRPQAPRPAHVDVFELPARQQGGGQVTASSPTRPAPPGRSDSRLDYAVDPTQLGKAIHDHFDANMAEGFDRLIVEEGGTKSPSPPPVPPYVPGPPAPYEGRGKAA